MPSACALNLIPAVFDEKRHIYRRVLDGPALASPSLVLRSLGIVREYPATSHQGFSPRDIGVAGHRMIQLHLEGKLDEASVHPVLVPRLTAFKDFCAATGFRAAACEVPLAHPVLPFAGKFDAVGAFSDDSEVLLDWKMGGVEDWVGIQTAAYDMLLPPTVNGKSRKRFALQLPESGRYNLIPFSDPDDGRVWLSLLNSFLWMRSHGYFKEAQ